MGGEIIVTIDPETNEVSISVRGLKGKVCTEYTEALEKALGTVTERKFTREHFETVPAKTTIKR